MAAAESRTDRWSDIALDLSALARTLTAGLSGALAEDQLSVDHWQILETIERLSAPTMGELAQETGLPNASLSRIVDALEDSASAYRVVDPDDRRRITVRLSDQGALRLARARTLIEAWERSLSSGPGDHLRAEFAQALAAASTALARHHSSRSA